MSTKGFPIRIHTDLNAFALLQVGCKETTRKPAILGCSILRTSQVGVMLIKEALNKQH